MSNCGQVHSLLYRVGCDHAESGLTAAHNVGVISEDVKSVGGNAAGSYVEYGRSLLTCELVHVGDHEEQTLGSCEGGGKSSGSDSAVNSTCSTCFGLHLYDLNFFAKDIYSILGSPVVHVFCHRGGRCDRVDRSYLRERICNMSGSGVSVHSL